jgi:hypothetical protein
MMSQAGKPGLLFRVKLVAEKIKSLGQASQYLFSN